MNHPLVHKANQWMKCFGSHRMQQVIEPLTTEKTDSQLEGIACHEYAQSILSTGEIIEDATPETVAFAEEYVEYVRKFSDGQPVTVETKVNLGFLMSGWYCIPDCYFQKGSQLHIIDAKFGHRIVDAEKNWQLIIEAIGICENDDTIETITFHIVQPRAFVKNASTWTINRDELTSLRRELCDVLVEVVGSNPQCTTGPHCTDCHARYTCNTLRREGFSAVQYVEDLSFSHLDGLSLGCEIELLQQAAEAIKNRLTGLEEQALHNLKRGQSVPGFGLKDSLGRKTWAKGVSNDKIIFLGEMSGVDAVKPVQLLTPAQMIEKGVSENAVNKLAYTPKRGVALVKESSSLAAKIFDTNAEKR